MFGNKRVLVRPKAPRPQNYIGIISVQFSRSNLQHNNALVG